MIHVRVCLGQAVTTEKSIKALESVLKSAQERANGADSIAEAPTGMYS